MAEDIVVRLRDAYENWSLGGRGPVLLALAADEIETLRHELAEADERARKKYAPCD